MNVRISGSDKETADDILDAIIKKLSGDESSESENDDSPEPVSLR